MFVTEWWKTAKDILKGKAKGSKLIILGVFMVSIGVGLDIYFRIGVGSVFYVLGVVAFMRGVSLYEDEARSELKKREKEKS
jgi:uncharacterized membrane protein